LSPQNASAEKLSSEGPAATASAGSSAWITIAQITIQAASWRKYRVRQMFTQVALDARRHQSIETINDAQHRRPNMRQDLP
jgi:hypothetical protein